MTPAESKYFWLHVELGKQGTLGEIVSRQLREISGDSADKMALEFTARIAEELGKMYLKASEEIMEASKL